MGSNASMIALRAIFEGQAISKQKERTKKWHGFNFFEKS